MAKFLQVGPFSVLNTDGILGGIAKERFSLLFLAVMTSIFVKGFPIAVAGLILIKANNINYLIALVVPNLLCTFTCIAFSTGLNKKLIQIISNYPAAWMLSFATFFIIGPIKSPCCSRTNAQTHHLGVSKPYTIINIVVTYVTYMTIFANSGYDLHSLSILNDGIGWPYMDFIAFHLPLFICVALYAKFLQLDMTKDTYIIDTTTDDLQIVKIIEKLYK